jgi:hypothetical protein
MSSRIFASRLLAGRTVVRIAAALALAAIFVALPYAQGRAADDSQNSDGGRASHWVPDIGGYSLHRRDIFGLQKPPPPPTDFGPTFDYEAQPMEGGVNDAPYEH